MPFYLIDCVLCLTEGFSFQVPFIFCLSVCTTGVFTQEALPLASVFKALSCHCTLTPSSGEGVRRGSANTGSQVEGRQQIYLFNNGEKLYTLPARRPSNPLTLRGCLSLARHN